MRERVGPILAAAGLLGLLALAYSNHFTNGFYFDDAHVISNNASIRDIRNVPSFFTDATTFSSLPANRAYRPIVTTLDAIDYWLAGGLDPVYFHASIFAAYVLQLALMVVFFRRLLDQVRPRRRNVWIALGATGLYGLHAANAETINYVSARSDSFSTLCIIAGLVLYQVGVTRRYHVYLVPAVLGILTKQTGAMFAPLLLLYIALFEERVWLPGDRASFAVDRLGRAAWKAAPTFVLCAGLVAFNQHYMTPSTTVSLDASASRLAYFQTQFFIVTHYLGNFLLPLRLSADPDFTIIADPLDVRVLFGLSVVAAMVAAAGVSLRRMETRPIAYGITWFFVALAPTSTFVPLYQIANDHRTFFPYVGLILAAAVSSMLLLDRFDRRWTSKPGVRWAVAAVFAAVACGHAYGTHARNQVWSSEETLWYDVTVKSPANGRGLMNYGLSQMALGRYDTALEYYERALEWSPYYSFLHINLGILKGAMGDPEAAEQYFRNALQYDRSNPGVYYYYARWLHQIGRSSEALSLLDQGVLVSPNNANILSLRTTLQEELGPGGADLVERLEREAVTQPSADGYINLGLEYYRLGRFEDTVTACRQALALDPDSAVAYSNMCSAYVRLGEYDLAIDACRRALEIQPVFDRAEANLAWAEGLRNEVQAGGAELNR